MAADGDELRPPRACGHCGGTSLYATTTTAGGTYGPDLLPGLGTFWSFADHDVVLCAECGYTQFFASPAARARVSNADLWRKL